jgi:hypothetical protein
VKDIFELFEPQTDTEWTTRWLERKDSGDQALMEVHVAESAGRPESLAAALEAMTGLSESDTSIFASWLRGGFDDEDALVSAVTQARPTSPLAATTWRALASTVTEASAAWSSMMREATRAHFRAAFEAESSSICTAALERAGACAEAAIHHAVDSSTRAGWQLARAAVAASKGSWLSASEELESALLGLGEPPAPALERPFLRDLGCAHLALGRTDAAFATWDRIQLEDAGATLPEYNWVASDARGRSGAVVRARQMLLIDGNFRAPSSWGVGGAGLLRVCLMLLDELLKLEDMALAEPLSLLVEQRVSAALDHPADIDADDLAELLSVSPASERPRLIALVRSRNADLAAAALAIADEDTATT